MNEAIVLAGGLGTRLRSEVPDLPKCMAPVAGKPFLDHVIEHYLDAGIHRFVFALGYMHETVLDHLATRWIGLDYDYCIEEKPLGTGGAVLLASHKTKGAEFFVLNGDTLFKIDALNQLAFHKSKDGAITIAAKPMHQFDRYGTVTVNDDGSVKSFDEKKYCISGLINGGVYVVNKSWLQSLKLPIKHSFEKDVMEAYVDGGKIFAMVCDEYFIDIGIPEDFKKANLDLIN
jgi:D-glycero-alpha-D-manno-heptose 1-phosphate guanylyltransferase